MKKILPSSLALAIGIFSTLPVLSLHAVNYTWQNNGTSWNEAANWSVGTGIPDGGGDLAIFTAVASVNPNLASSVAISRMTANSSSAQGYTLTASEGATLTLGTDGTGTSSAINYTPTTGSIQIDAPVIFGAADTKTQTVNVNSASSSVFGNVIINGAVTTTNIITIDKTGGGHLTLSNASNSWAGDIRVSGGTLVMSGAGVLGSGDLIMNSGAFDISGISGTTFTHSASLTGEGTVEGGGNTLAVGGLNADGTISLSDTTLSLSGTTTFDFTDNTLASGTYDLVEGSDSSVVLSGLLSLNFTGGTYADGLIVQIFDVENYSGDFSSISVTGLNEGQSVSFDNLTGTISVIPEPQTSSLLVGVGALILTLSPRRSSPRDSSLSS
jgi:autotransporter-associated beta strand protein